jgi:AraC-like DNA-binding protein
MTSRVQQALEDERSLATASLEDVAATLHVSARSVRRRLADEGTSFRVVVARARQVAADRLFAAGCSVEQAAGRLGYADSSSFAHAFKRWTGVTPESWRRTRLSGDGHRGVGGEATHR